jgi:glycosyltransferase involved in cell wall biosynthesis
MSIDKYTIHHFDLAAESISYDSVKTGAHYCVFWYRSIPLGDLYISNSEPLSERDFYALSLDAIWPALEQYYSSRYKKSDLIKPMTLSRSVVKDICESIVGHLHEEKISSQCDVSVVICTRDRADQLKQCLTLLQQQVCKPSEIIVVDNASITEDTKHVAQLFPGVRYVAEPRPGLDVARNTGAREARCSIIAYTDDDTIPDANWVYRVFETLKNPLVSAMTGLVIAASLQTEAEIIFEKHWPFNRGYRRKVYDHHFFSSTLETGPPVWEIGAGANMAFRKEIFEEVGYFDERLDVGAAGCSGDSEMWYRILANNYSIVYNPLAVVQHSHRSSIEGLKKQLYGYMRGFTVAILIQYDRFKHVGNLKHLVKVFPFYYLSLVRKGFPGYNAQYKTLLSEMSGILSGFIYYWKHRNSDPKIF